MNILSTTKLPGNGVALSMINTSNISDGTLTVVRGGTGVGTFTEGRLLIGNGTTSITVITESANLTWTAGTNTLTVVGTTTATGISGTTMGTNTLSVTGTTTITTVSADNIGIGITNPETQLHTYHVTEIIIRLQTGSTGKSSIQFVRGIETDTLVQFQRLPTPFGDSDSFLMDSDRFKTLFYKI